MAVELTGSEASVEVPEARLKRWVAQPPASPNVQYLRDAEREAALALLGPRASVLDVASEAGVTAGASRLAGHLARADFSEDASAHAQTIVGDDADDFAVADPRSPALPYDDDSFDGAVSLGPFDWPFLDVDALVAEVRRVLRPGGVFVYSVPTPRSPYARTGKSRTYEPEAALGLLGTDWRVVGRELVFQYPGPAHTAVNRLPHPAQRPFVALAGAATRGLTALDAWHRASYLVIAATPVDYVDYLTRAVDALFRPVEAGGFFDAEEGTVTRALTYELEGSDNGHGVDGRVRWAHDTSNEWRYATFALAGLLRWRVSPLGDDRHDDRLRATLDYFADVVADPEDLSALPSYGLGPLCGAFALAARAFGGDSGGSGSSRRGEPRNGEGGDAARYLAAARLLHEHTRATVRFDHSEDSLVLYGWTFLHDVDPSAALLEDVDRGLDAVLARLSDEGLFAFENATTRRHQNQMYALWGVSRAIRTTGRDGHLPVVEGVLEYTIGKRMRPDGAFVWEDLPPARRLLDAVHERRTGDTAYWRYLYECHQTFFVNAVAHYYEAGGSRDYDGAVRRAMGWIFGSNGLGRDLVEVSGIGVPMRQLATDGRMDHRRFVGGVRDQQYKGTYEVGSYVAALTHLLDGTID